ncbi:MAG: site-specific integrase [Clostridia bacterium]|nr:site-specific integrase [Clostridia bacterium]
MIFYFLWVTCIISIQREAIKDINAQLLNFEKEEAEGKSFKSVAERWNDEYREKISHITYNKSTRAAYDRILDYFADCKDITKLTALEINVFLNNLILQNFYKKTITTHKSVLNMIFSYAVLHGYVKFNPLKDVRLPANLPKKQRELPTTEEIKEVEKHYTGFDLLPYFLLNTGLRVSEALAIDADKDIDFDKKTITVNKHVIHDGNRPVLEDRTKTENSKRTVILLDRLADKLPRDKKGLLFGNEDGTPLTKRQLACRWKKYQYTYGINLTAHQLRHAYATILFEAGVDVKDAQELMGHSDINLTRQIYTHIRNERKEETANKLNNFNL